MKKLCRAALVGLVFVSTNLSFLQLVLAGSIYDDACFLDRSAGRECNLNQGDNLGVPNRQPGYYNGGNYGGNYGSWNYTYGRRDVGPELARNAGNAFIGVATLAALLAILGNANRGSQVPNYANQTPASVNGYAVDTDHCTMYVDRSGQRVIACRLVPR